MPHILSPRIIKSSPGMWYEGDAYERRKIYSIEDGKMPPVNYDEHIFRPHSLTHFETPAHTIPNGKRVEFFYNDLKNFYGKTLVLKLPGYKYEMKNNGIFHWIITCEELKEQIEKMGLNQVPGKILISTEFYPVNGQGYHDPNYVLTLSQDAADYLVSIESFHLYGTSWKSSDFNPGKPERPIHNTLFKKAGILENLDLKNVSEGIYFMTAFPLPIEDASEAPVVPALFSKEELEECFK